MPENLAVKIAPDEFINECRRTCLTTRHAFDSFLQPPRKPYGERGYQAEMGRKPRGGVPSGKVAPISVMEKTRVANFFKPVAAARSPGGGKVISSCKTEFPG